MLGLGPAVWDIGTCLGTAAGCLLVSGGNGCVWLGPPKQARAGYAV